MNFRIFLMALLTSFSLSLMAKVAEIDPAASRLKWTGKKTIKLLGESHFGQVPIVSGNFDAEAGKGSVVVSLAKLTVEDIKDAKKNQKLKNHLHSADFFSTKEFPTSTLEITSYNDKKNVAKGKLTIKNITKKIQFPLMKTTDNTFSGKLVFDRTKYNIEYMPKTLKGKVVDKFINDDVELDFTIVTKNTMATKATK